MNKTLDLKKTLALLVIGFTVLHSMAQKPNLVIIHTDEHNFRTLGCYRQQMSEDQAYVWGKGLGVETPNIDRIANEGAICMNYYASTPVCSPSRASMLTGMYRQTTGVYSNNLNLREDVPTFAKILKANGYATSYLGKWHLEDSQKYQFNIKYNAGFDDDRYLMSRGHNPYFHITKNGLEAINKNQAAVLPKNEVVHLTDYFMDNTLKILERDKNKPFCLMVSIPDPHTPDIARPPYDTMFDNMDLQAPKTMADKYLDTRPKWAASEKNEAHGFKPEGLRQYFGMVKHIDDKVGEVLAFLDKNNLVENTIIIFTSDHGDLYFEHNRMNKGNAYEASARIPFVIRYPKKIKAGKVIRKAYCNVDFTPTILALMDVKTDIEFDGRNTANDYTNKKMMVAGDEFTHFAGSGDSWVSLVNNRYKLVLSISDKPWLFDLQEDPDELTNFYNKPNYEKISNRLMKVLKQRMETYDERILKTASEIIYE